MHYHPRETDGSSVHKTNHSLVTSTNNLSKDRLSLSQGLASSESIGKGNHQQTDQALLSSV